VPINAKLHAREFQYILDNSGSKICFVTPDLHHTIASVADDLENLQCVIDVASAELEQMAVCQPAVIATVKPDDPAWLFYTSGTTGRPKGATLSHRNLIAQSLSYYADIDPVTPQDTQIHPAPLSHGSGLYALPHIAMAANNVIPEDEQFDPLSIFELIESYPGVSFFAAPTMVNRLINSHAAEQADMRNLKTIVYGGGPMYVADLQQAMQLWGARLSQLYGQGEAPMTITGLSKAQHADTSFPKYQQLLASVGFPRTGVEVKVVDPDDNECGHGEIGEIVARGDVVMTGYWHNPAATSAALRNGWLHTGDLGIADEAGFFTLKDRSKDMIISGGVNIYPREIEEVLLSDERILEASVVGRSHPDWGEEVVAFVVTKPDVSVTAESLDQLCLENIARFKRPKEYIFVVSLPKNNYGKILKTELRTELKNRPKV